MTNDKKLGTISKQPASILGLGGNENIDIDYVNTAFQAGINYFFFYNLKCDPFVYGIKSLTKNQRENVLIATGSEARSCEQLKQYLDKVRQCLNIDIVDVFFLEYVSPHDDLESIKSLLEQLNNWKSTGLIRYVGVTSHNKNISLKLVKNSPFDVLMQRYNMAHRKAAETVFYAAENAEIPIIAFTCTRWSSLLQGHPNWQKKIPKATDCYRYVLRNQAVTIALTAPQTLTQLKDNLQVLSSPKMNQTEASLWESYGDLIYGKGKDDFDTKWL